MSIATVDYALAVLELDDELAETPRFVLLLLAARANVNTAETFTGRWLTNAGRWHRSTIWRAVVELETAGWIAVEHRPGRSSRVLFPDACTAGDPQKPPKSYPQPVAVARHEQTFARRGSATDPSRRRDRPVAVARHVSGTQSGTQSASAASADGCELCAGTGFISVEVMCGERSTWQSTPCHCHPTRQVASS